MNRLYSLQERLRKFTEKKIKFLYNNILYKRGSWENLHNSTPRTIRKIIIYCSSTDPLKPEDHFAREQ